MKQLLLSVLLSCTGLLNAASISVSSTAPTTDTDDIANLVAATGSEQIWNDRRIQGQTFKTAASLYGHELNAITVQIFDNDATPGPADRIEGWKDYRFRVGKVGSGTFTPFYDAITRYDPDATANDYHTLTFTSPLFLAGDQDYAFEVGLAASQDSFSTGIIRVNRSGDTFADGFRYQTSENQNTKTLLETSNVPGSGTLDLVFALDITSIPEPTSLALIGLSGLALLRRRR
ncbi:MAG: PEP-CTERM sorting domain-containing protein [Akkermansiaceae bacterium]